MKSEKIKNPFILLHISVLLAGFTGLFGKLISLNEVDLTWYRCAIATLILFIFVGLPSVKVKTLAAILGCGALQGLHWILFYGSIKASNISIGVVCYALVGFFTALIEPMVFHKKVSALELAYSILTLLGLIFIFSFDSRYRLGIIIGIFSSLASSTYIVLNKKVSQGVPSRTFLFYLMLGGVIGVGLLKPLYLAIFSISSPMIVLPSVSDIGWLICLSFFCTIILYLFQIISLQTLSAFTVNLTYNLEPIYAILMAFLFFGESHELNFAFYVGISMILISVLLQSLRTTSSKR